MAAELPVSIILRAVNRVTQPLRAVTNDFADFRRHAAGAAAAFDFSSKVSLASQAVSGFADSAMNAVRRPLEVAQSFEAAMARVRAVSGATAEEHAKLSEVAEELGATTRFSASEAAAAMGALGTAGYKAEQMIQTMPSLLGLSAASGVELGRTADILAKTMGGFGLEASEAARVSDVLAAAFTGSNTTLETLFETMKQAAPVARDLGLPIEQVAAMSGMLGNAGIEASQAGTAMRAVFMSLTKQSTEAAQVMDALGVQTSDAAGNLRPVTDIFAEMSAKMAGLGSGTRSEALATVFGREAAPAISVLLKAMDSGELESFTEAMQNATGTTERLRAIMNATAEGAAFNLQSAIEAVQNAFGKPLLEPIRRLRVWLADLLGGVKEWAKENETATKWIGMTAGTVALLAKALAGFLVAMAAGSAAWGVLKYGFGITKTAAIALGGSLKWVVGRVWALIRGLVTLALTLLKAVYVALKQVVIVLVRSVVPALFRVTLAVLRLAFVLITRAAIAIASFVAGLVTMAATALATLIPALISATAAVVSFGLAFLLTPVGLILALIALIAAGVYLIYENWDEISAWFADLWEGVKQTFSDAWGWIKSGFTSLANWFDALWKRITGSFTKTNDFILEKLKPVTDLVGKTRAYLPEWMGGTDSARKEWEAARARGEAVPTLDGAGGAQVSGAIRIEIDAEGRPRVQTVQSRGGVDLDVDTGLGMVTP